MTQIKTTPIGEIKWSHIHKPNKKFVKAGEYGVEVEFLKSEFLNLKKHFENVRDEFIKIQVKEKKITKENANSIIRVDIVREEEDSIILRAKRKVNSDYGNIIPFFNIKGERLPSLKKEFSRGDKIRIKIFPKPYYIQAKNEAGISFKINEIIIIKEDMAQSLTRNTEFKTISAKIPMELVAEYERVRGQYFGINFSSPTMVEVISAGIKKTIEEMEKEMREKS